MKSNHEQYLKNNIIDKKIEKFIHDQNSTNFDPIGQIQNFEKFEFKTRQRVRNRLSNALTEELTLVSALNIKQNNIFITLEF